MRLYDQHLHSRHSWDSKADPVAHVEAAFAQGLGGLTFTEHFDTHPDEWGRCAYDHEAYSATINQLRDAFGDRIFIGQGLEVCYQPDRIPFILDFLRAHQFDVVLLSVHYFGKHPIHAREHWANITPTEGTRRYLERVLEAVRFCETLHRTGGRVFDILGHLDLVKRYTQRFFGMYDLSPFADLIDEILRVCLAADLTLELNTSTLRQNLDEPMPGPQTIARYAQLGGRAVSLGSDAHRSEHIAADFDHALEIIRTTDINHTVVFRKRQRIEVPIKRGLRHGE